MPDPGREPSRSWTDDGKPPRSQPCSTLPAHGYISPPRLPPSPSSLSSTTPVQTMLQSRQELTCGVGGGADTHFRLRIGSIFIILVGAGGGALFPVLIKRSKRITLPGYVFEYVYPFCRLSVLISDLVQVRKILWIWCNRALNPRTAQESPVS